MNDVDILDIDGTDNLHFVHVSSDFIIWVQYLWSISGDATKY